MAVGGGSRGAAVRAGGEGLAPLVEPVQDQPVEAQQQRRGQEAVERQVHPGEHPARQRPVGVAAAHHPGPPRAARGQRHELRRPEDVGVDEGEERQQGGDHHARPAHAAHLRGPQRQPDGQEALERDGHDEPGGGHEGEVGEEDEQLAGGLGDVQQLEAPHHPHPRLEGGGQQHGRVGHGQEGQVPAVTQLHHRM